MHLGRSIEGLGPAWHGESIGQSVNVLVFSIFHRTDIDGNESQHTKDWHAMDVTC